MACVELVESNHHTSLTPMTCPPGVPSRSGQTEGEKPKRASIYTGFAPSCPSSAKTSGDRLFGSTGAGAGVASGFAPALPR